MFKINFTILSIILLSLNGLAQISPPGLGKTNAASWFAVGVKQRITKKANVNSTSYLGIGRISRTDNFNPISRQSLYVVNEEIEHKFNGNWKYSLALSYRWQNKYKSNPPYELDASGARQELRFYGKITYEHSISNLDLSFSYRPELRLFYNPDFTMATNNIKFRSRLKGKLAFNLNALKTQKLVTTTELLFSSSHNNRWGKFEYKDLRLCLYYSVTFPKQRMELHLGYMNDMLGLSDIKGVNYLAVDVVFKNVFGKF